MTEIKAEEAQNDANKKEKIKEKYGAKTTGTGKKPLIEEVDTTTKAAEPEKPEKKKKPTRHEQRKAAKEKKKEEEKAKIETIEVKKPAPKIDEIIPREKVEP